MEAATKTVAIVLTYADRFHYLERTCEAASRAGVDSIVVVDNGSPPANAAAIARYLEQNGNCLHLLRLDTNRGSAAGYTRGLRHVLEGGYELPCLVWLLDDDNLVDPDCLGRLQAVRSSLGDDPSLVLACHRLSREAFYQRAARFGGSLVPNSFADFHLLVPDSYPARRNRASELPALLDLACCPYGGAQFDSRLLEIIGTPDEDFFTYGDDFEFTHRAGLVGGRVVMVRDAHISDQEESFLSPGGAPAWLSARTDPGRLFLVVRNHVKLKRRVGISNRGMFYLNASAYLLFFGLAALVIERRPTTLARRIWLIVNAMRAGSLPFPDLESRLRVLAPHPAPPGRDR